MNKQSLMLDEILENIQTQDNSVSRQTAFNPLKDLKITPEHIEKMFASESKNPKREKNKTSVFSHAFNNAEVLRKTNICGCFYCCEIYSPLEIKEWIKEKNIQNGLTAVCPKCGTDAVIAEHSSSFANLSVDILRQLNIQKF